MQREIYQDMLLRPRRSRCANKQALKATPTDTPWSVYLNQQGYLTIFQRWSEVLIKH